MTAELRFLHYRGREIRPAVHVASVVPECAWSARRTFWIMSHEVQLNPAASNSPAATQHSRLRLGSHLGPPAVAADGRAEATGQADTWALPQISGRD